MNERQTQWCSSRDSEGGWVGRRREGQGRVNKGCVRGGEALAEGEGKGTGERACKREGRERDWNGVGEGRGLVL